MGKLTVFLVFLSCLLVYSCEKKEVQVLVPPSPKDTAISSEDSLRNIIELSTSYGKMYIWLYDATPLHKNNFLSLADSGFFNNTTFHRIILGFMIQGGDPNSKDNDSLNDGSGGPNYTIPAEIRSDIKHKRGVIAAARTNNPAKASSGSQFYISVSTSGTAGLNNNYTVFGYVMKGIEYADSIVKQPRKPSNDRPYKNIPMQVKVIKKSRKEMKAEYGYTPEF